MLGVSCNDTILVATYHSTNKCSPFHCFRLLAFTCTCLWFLESSYGVAVLMQKMCRNCSNDIFREFECESWIVLSSLWAATLFILSRITATCFHRFKFYGKARLLSLHDKLITINTLGLGHQPYAICFTLQ